jgi:ABC-type lipoprotein release transport system permease subunit
MGSEFWSSPLAILAMVGAGLIVLGLVAIVLTTSVYKHFVCLKYLFSGWKAVVPFVTALPAALGVFLLILVFAIMDGFANDMRQMARGTTADIIVDAHLEGLPHYEEFIRRIEKIEGVEVATPIIQALGVARVKPHRQSYPRVETDIQPSVRWCFIIGIRPAEKAALGQFMEYLARPALQRKLLAEIDRGVEFLGAGQPTSDERVVQRQKLRQLYGDIVEARESALCQPQEAEAALESVAICESYMARGDPLPAATTGQVIDGLRVFRGRLEVLKFPAEKALDVPALSARATGPPRAGCIAGIGLISASMLWPTPEILYENAEWRLLAWVLALVSLVLALVLWASARRRPDRRGRRVATIVVAAVTLGLVAMALLMPVRPVEVMREDNVLDIPLIDYGGELVVSTIPITASGAVAQESGGLPKVSSRALVLADIFKSRYWENDEKHLYVDFKVAQQMAGMEAQPATEDHEAMPARCSQVQVKIKDPARQKVIIGQMREVWDQLAAERRAGVRQVAFNTWQDQQRTILNVVEVEKSVTVLMLGLMFLGFAVLIALVSYVMAYIKSRDIGILKAIGARDTGVGSLFLGYGFIIGVAGVTVGVAAALLMLANLDAIELWASSVLHVKLFPRDVYYFDHIPRHLSALWCLGVCASVLAMSTLASLAGGLLATLKQPVEALRYE